MQQIDGDWDELFLYNMIGVTVVIGVANII